MKQDYLARHNPFTKTPKQLAQENIQMREMLLLYIQAVQEIQFEGFEKGAKTSQEFQKQVFEFMGLEEWK